VRAASSLQNAKPGGKAVRYWDSSALVPLIVNEATTVGRQDLLRQDNLVVTWWGSLVECASALNRLHREGNLNSQERDQALDKIRRYAAKWLSIRASKRVQQRALDLLRTHPLRAADALQLAAALAARDNTPAMLEVVCGDGRLSAAAVKEGFIVL
jgi:predicted nucleic acid-binding protein